VKHSPDQVLVVVNSASPTSRAIAADYVQKRKIKNVVTVKCADSALNPDNETVPYADFTTLIEQPVRDYLAKHSGIDFIVLTKGIPLRVKGGETGNAIDGGIASPSVDSSLAALDYATIPDAKKYHFASPNNGAGDARGNAWANRYWNSNEPFSHEKFGGYLVSRLDGYTRQGAMGLVTEAIASEHNPPKGKVLLDVQPDFQLGDKAANPKPSIDFTLTAEAPWDTFNADMAHAADILQARGIPYELDLNQKFVGERRDLAGYYSWGSNDSHFKAPAYASLRFAPGSISDTAVSTCARTFLPTEGGQTLTADLLAHGLTAAKGYVNEPWLQANSSPSIVLDHYTSGYTMAESFYAGSRFVGWEDIVIGDPLCAPYLK
jgi:uncharacterized protein (TIGR03790 family)